jgi:AcrR family transcriptional regulator
VVLHTVRKNVQRSSRRATVTGKGDGAPSRDGFSGGGDGGWPPGGVSERILKIAKGLFAAKGFEQARTSEIARLALTSESQLVKYFGGKNGLLLAVFERGWQGIVADAESAAAKCELPSKKLQAITRVDR